jgi:2-hydroxychromene-2-carboxylate isomerase
MAQITYYFSTISPYAYLAGSRLEDIAAKHGASIVYKPLDVVTLFARTGGTAPKDRHPARQEYRIQELHRYAAIRAMPFNLHPAHWPTNAAPSSYALIAAQRAGGGDVGALARGYLRACWAEERDIAQDDVVRDCLEQAGFDPNLANSGLLLGAEEYSANLDDAVAAGAFGSPFYITEDDQRFWGQDRLEMLDYVLSSK